MREKGSKSTEKQKKGSYRMKTLIAQTNTITEHELGDENVIKISISRIGR